MIITTHQLPPDYANLWLSQGTDIEITQDQGELLLRARPPIVSTLVLAIAIPLFAFVLGLLAQALVSASGKPSQIPRIFLPLGAAVAAVCVTLRLVQYFSLRNQGPLLRTRPGDGTLQVSGSTVSIGDIAAVLTVSGWIPPTGTRKQLITALALSLRDKPDPLWISWGTPPLHRLQRVGKQLADSLSKPLQHATIS